MEFYQILAEKLRTNGILVVQSGAASFSENEMFTSVCNTLGKVFFIRIPLCCLCSFLRITVGFSLATHNPSNLDISSDEIDARVHSRINGELRFMTVLPIMLCLIYQSIYELIFKNKGVS